MKNKSINLLLASCIMYLFCLQNIICQNYCITEKTSSGDIYQIDTITKSVTNIANTINTLNIGKQCEHYTISKTQIIDDIVSESFSKEKLKCLAEQNKTIRLTKWF